MAKTLRSTAPQTLLDVVRPLFDKHKLGAKQKELAEIYLKGLPVTEFAKIDADNLLAHINSIYSFYAERPDSFGPKVRVTNPEYTHHTVVEVLTDDQPFLLDTIWVELAERGFEIHHSFHPILCSTRDKNGKIKTIATCPLNAEGKAEKAAESLIHIEFDRQDNLDLPLIEKRLSEALSDAHSAVRDFPRMQTQLKNLLQKVEQQAPRGNKAQHDEDVAFLHWMLSDNFIFLGYRHYDISYTGKDTFMQVSPNTGMGILNDGAKSSVAEKRNITDLPPNVKHYIADPRLLIITKALSKSRVHRKADLDYIGIKEFDAKGRMVGEHRFVGLFTSKAYNTPSHEIPIIGQKINEVLFRERAEGMHGHNIKALRHILETYPKDELFQIDVDDLQRIATGILHLQERQHVKLFVRRNSHERTITALVFLPRERMSTSLRQRISEILMTSYNGEDLEFNVNFGDFPLARIFYKIRLRPTHFDAPNDAVVEGLIAEAAVSWQDDLRKALVEHFGEQEGLRVFRTYAKSFRGGYRENTSVDEAVHDVAYFERMARGQSFLARLSTPDSFGQTDLKLYHQGSSISLSAIMPLFSNMGLNVRDEHSNRVDMPNGDHVWLHTFRIEATPGQKLGDQATRSTLEQAIVAAWQGTLESCSLNTLIPQAGLSVAQVIYLRSWVAYMQQIGLKYDLGYVRATLIKHAALAKLVVELFEARFNPEISEATSKTKQKAVLAKLEEGLAAVTVLDEDVIIRRLVGIVKAMVRTNAWQRSKVTEPLAYKIRSREVPDLVKPHPIFEIFVYHSGVEGIHLRGGMVARGGLRWSDRPADFRTEVLGLMKTQMTKNAVIVPVGSKGGFVVKNLPCDPKTGTCDRKTLMAAVEDRYATFIRSLLSVTDNVTAEGKIVPPRTVRRWDTDDAYFVVAADKGTATFSDIANGIAQKADFWDGITTGFWLGDAFASGGSYGYDHKKMGITAKGAWECVKHHFRTLGKNIQEEDFTVVGIGDMAGDVFGNGMLLSEHIQLQVAFNHLHIFVDPTPNAAKGFKERQRLFTTPNTTWADYDKKLISKGGGVFNRSDKEIKLSPEMKQMLGVEAESLSPNELIKAALKMQVDLLWNGGIGTFIKATTEAHEQVGDRANNDIRINATEVRAKVIGEGGNLGMTQRARIEYALNGGLLNTDAIDNSAGVDCSDHEVNIKILLRLAEQQKGLNFDKRNKFLAEMTDDVARLVLRDNYLQTQVISIKFHEGMAATDTNFRLQRHLQRIGLLDAAIENLPDEETLENRRRDGQGYTRPELAVLLSYAKMDLFNELVASDLPDAPILEPYLVHYFPQAIQKKYADLLPQHQLKREIIATAVANELVNRMGLTFLNRMRDETGFDAASITRAFIIAKTLMQADNWWQTIEGLDNKVPAGLQIEMLLVVKKAVEFMVFWLLRYGEKPLNMRTELERHQKVFAHVLAEVEQHLTPLMRERHFSRSSSWIQQGLEKETATKLSLLQLSLCAPDISTIASHSGAKVADVLKVYFSLGEQLRFDYLHATARALPVKDNWDRLATLAVVEDLSHVQKTLTQQAFSIAGKGYKSTDAVVKKWQEAKAGNLEQLAFTLEELQTEKNPSHAMLNVITGQLKALTI